MPTHWTTAVSSGVFDQAQFFNAKAPVAAIPVAPTGRQSTQSSSSSGLLNALHIAVPSGAAQPGASPRPAAFTVSDRVPTSPGALRPFVREQLARAPPSAAPSAAGRSLETCFMRAAVAETTVAAGCLTQAQISDNARGVLAAVRGVLPAEPAEDDAARPTSEDDLMGTLF
jgi:hypothetical protein